MTDNNYIKNRIDYITFANVIACFSVLILHTNVLFWNWNPSSSFWKAANVIEGVFYFAVPVFFMITGVTLMDFFDRYSLKLYFYNRLKKAFLPFLAWSLIAICVNVYRGRIDASDINIKFLYEGTVGTSIVSIFWFFTSLFTIYLCIPLFAAVEEDKRKSVFSYLVVCGFVLNILLPFLKTFFQSELSLPYNIPVVSGYVFWPVVGWLLHHYELKTYQKCIIYILAVVGLFMHIEGTYILSYSAGGVVDTFKGYYNVPCVLYSVGIFLLLKDVGSVIMKKEAAAKAFRWVGQFTFSIYLIQYFFIYEFSGIFGIEITSAIYPFVTALVISIIIIAISWCLKKIPVIKYIVP